MSWAPGSPSAFRDGKCAKMSPRRPVAPLCLVCRGCLGPLNCSPGPLNCCPRPWTTVQDLQSAVWGLRSAVQSTFWTASRAPALHFRSAGPMKNAFLAKMHFRLSLHPKVPADDSFDQPFPVLHALSASSGGSLGSLGRFWGALVGPQGCLGRSLEASWGTCADAVWDVLAPLRPIHGGQGVLGRSGRTKSSQNARLLLQNGLDWGPWSA